MSKVGLIFSSITLVLSLIVHLSSFIPALSITMAMAAPLHLLAMACFALMIFTGIPLFRSRGRRTGEGTMAYWKRAARESADSRNRAIQYVPKPARIVAGLAIAYAVFNFVAFAALTEGGVPAKEDGKYYLHSHGNKIRDLSKEEYGRMQANVARGFSGHWIVFSLIPTLFFAYVRPRLQSGRELAPPISS